MKETNTQPAPKATPASKTLDAVNSADVKAKASDVKIVGNPDILQLLCKASSESQGWMKSAKAMQAGNGVVVQVTTQQRNPDDSYTVAEALTFVPSAKIVDDVNGGRKVVHVH